MPEIKDVKDLKSIVEKTIKALYGEEVTDLKISGATQFPIYGAKTFWAVTVEFQDDKYVYGVELSVQMNDGTVTRTSERWRQEKPL